jgi:indole-3-glycerol phosphate synthase
MNQSPGLDSEMIMNTLDRICADKRGHVETRKGILPLADLEISARAMPPPRGFRQHLETVAAQSRPALIGEIKKASPSGGVIRADFDPARLAATYETAGAACLSVLTDSPWFQGRDEDLAVARNACALPALRKDFMIDPYQIAESRALGADCILLIMAALSDSLAAELYAAARNYGLDVLVEVHDEHELDRAVRLGADMIGVNSRNLKTLNVDLAIAHALSSRMPDNVLRIAESGIRTNDDITALQASGFRAFLVGESLMRQDDLNAAIKKLLGNA